MPSIPKVVKVGLVQIEFSEEASAYCNGKWYSAFQRNSYIARFTHSYDYECVVILPPNARKQDHANIVAAVLFAAGLAYGQNRNVVLVSDYR